MIHPRQWLRHIEDSKEIFFRGNTDVFRAFEFSRSYSAFYDSLIKSILIDVSKEVFGTEYPPGVAVFSFGAPARKEMFGGSDADVAVYRIGNTDKELLFRERFVDLLDDFNFTKVDTPVWGTLDDIQRYMETSVTEANQVMEAQFIYGDHELRDQVEDLRGSLYDQDTIARNLLFQFFYFEQYYSRKSSPGHLNLKYCPGGIRDFLFPMWYAQLREGVARDLVSTTMERGLNTLLNEELLSEEEVSDIVRYASAIAFIRDEVMQLIPSDKDGKLNAHKASELHKRRPHLFKKPKKIMMLVEESRRKVIYTKARIWEGLCKYFADNRSDVWNDYFKRTLAGENPELPSEFEFDEVINTARIWNFNAHTAEESFDYIAKISESDSWIVLASLLSSPYVSGSVVDSIVRRRGVTPGYEYFLEIAARNPNLEMSTLEFIIADNSTEPRFKKPALILAKELGL